MVPQSMELSAEQALSRLFLICREITTQTMFYAFNEPTLDSRDPNQGLFLEEVLFFFFFLINNACSNSYWHPRWPDFWLWVWLSS